jgi:hypothetical protein
MTATPRAGAELHAALTEVMQWISNWSPPFVEDDEWPATAAKVKAALTRVPQPAPAIVPDARKSVHGVALPDAGYNSSSPQGGVERYCVICLKFTKYYCDEHGENNMRKLRKRSIQLLASPPAPAVAPQEQPETVRVPVGGSLLHKIGDPLPAGCYCNPGECMAPTIMGRQMPCRDPQKAAAPKVQP